MKHWILKCLSISCLPLFMQACQTVDDERIPNMPVNISISDIGLWNTYGVSGFGSNRNFILTSSGTRIPTGFPYTTTSATGFGGVLLIEGLDIYSSSVSVPLAYDLACPVERQTDVRVRINPDTFYAECPVCESVYDVTLGAGGPVSGIAATGSYKYGLKQYACIATGSGGYYITN